VLTAREVGRNRFLAAMSSSRVPSDDAPAGILARLQRSLLYDFTPTNTVHTWVNMAHSLTIHFLNLVSQSDLMHSIAYRTPRNAAEEGL
jgi:hypothetical protein